MKTTIDKFGSIDYLINNAGGQFMNTAGEFSLKGWNAVVETNLTGTFLCCREGIFMDRISTVKSANRLAALRSTFFSKIGLLTLILEKNG